MNTTQVGKLHIITDTGTQQKFSHFDLTKMAFEAGAHVVQYRRKGSLKRRDLAEVKKITRLPRHSFQKWVVNDHVELAKNVSADGVHLGKEDMEVEEARKILPESRIIGATIHSLSELEEIKGKPITYIGVGPVYGTTSKKMKLPPLGIEKFREICSSSPIPVIAIGSIQLNNVREVMAAGAHGVAILSAFCKAKNPKKCVQEFLQILGN